ncbi:HlyD family efflux transporter periplasmic adaptor subunit [Peptoniphilus sp.]|uniref:HlyD family efflux transporter periplasmic adaptor subunit n=1 Tax=Peptoniphilus sp. TaxID=1971214 RepID=UPI003D915A81
MNTKSKKKNKYFYRRIFALIFLLLVIFFIIKFIRGRTFSDYKTVFPTLTTYEDDFKTKIFNIYNEKVYYSEGDGVAVFNASEGQKVPVGYEVCYLNLMEDVSSYKDQLSKIKAAIDLKNGIEPEDNTSDFKINKGIQEIIRDKNYASIYNDIDSLNLENKVTYSASELKEYMDLSEAELKEKQNELENIIEKYNVSYKAEFSGIVSYKIDGAEKKFDIKKLDKIDYNYLKQDFGFSRSEMNSQVKKDEALFKIIDNFDWKLAATVDNISKIKNYNIGDTVRIELDDSKTIYGTIEKINKTGNRAVIIVDLDRYIEDMYSSRVHEGKIVLERTKVYEIPKSTLTERDKVTGVFVQEIKGLVRFVPVEIVSEKPESIFINRGNKQSIIQIGEKTYKTVTVNDAVVINPRTVDESRILN